jgi:hypothetical protein
VEAPADCRVNNDRTGQRLCLRFNILASQFCNTQRTCVGVLGSRPGEVACIKNEKV